jgi:hypothetical protein
MVGEIDSRVYANECVLAFPQKMVGRIAHHRKAKNIQSLLNAWNANVSVKKGINYSAVTVVLSLGVGITGILLSLWRLH